MMISAKQVEEAINSHKKTGDYKELLEELIQTNKEFQHLGRDEVNVLNTCVDAKIKLENGEEMINMCEALEQIRREAAEKAAKEATETTTRKVTEEITKKVTEEVTKEVTKEVTWEVTKEVTREVTKEMEQTRIAGLVQMIHSLMENMHLTAEMALDSLNISADDRKTVTPLL